MVGLVSVARHSLPPYAIGALALLVVVLATGWVAVERRAVSPMVDLRMLSRPVMWQACLLTFVITGSLGMVVFLLPQLFAVAGTASAPTPPASAGTCCPAPSPGR